MAMRFLNEAQAYGGACRNRMDSTGRWTDEPTTGDHWGRCIWGLGTAAAHSDVSLVRQVGGHPVRARRAGAVECRRGRWRSRRSAPPSFSPSTPTTARPASSSPTTPPRFPLPNDDPAWPWPEPRLTYANAVLAEAMIAAGVALDDMTLRQRGLDLLGWLVEHRNRGRASVAHPGWRAGVAEDARPAFDQQPIEVATLADACARAAAVDAGPIWPDSVRAAAAWFKGDNDAGQVMWDPETGGGFDGLHADGRES